MSKYKIGDKVIKIKEPKNEVQMIEKINYRNYEYFYQTDISGNYEYDETEIELYKTAHEKLIDLGLHLKVTKNYAGGVFSHEWWNENNDRVIAFYIGEKLTTVYEGNNEIMKIIPQYLEELEK